MSRHPTHTFDADMRCILCRCPYAGRPDACPGKGEGNLNLGALAKRNAYLERQAEQRRAEEQATVSCVQGMIR